LEALVILSSLLKPTQIVLVLYGIGISLIGDLGPVIGWTLFMIMLILTAQLWGVLQGDWKGSRKKERILIVVGIFFLFSAGILVSLSSKF